MRIRLPASWKSNRLNNDIQIDHLVSCKCQVRVIFQNNTFVQLGQMRGHTVSSCGGQRPPSFCWSLSRRAPLLIRTSSALCMCVHVCECVQVREWGEGRSQEGELSLLHLKMILLVSSVWEKENVVQIKKKKKKRVPNRKQFLPPLLEFGLRSLNHSLLFLSLHHNHAVWFPTL